MPQSQVHFIGGGQMAEAIIRALVQGTVFAPDQLSVTDVDSGRLAALRERYGVGVSDTAGALGRADLIVLGVRPQDDLEAVGQLVLQHGRTEAIVVSLIAGVPIERLDTLTGGVFSVVRIIPNTLTSTGFGYSGVALGAKALESAARENPVLTAFLTGFGKVEYVGEGMLDTFTGYGVAGPNYVYYFIEAFADAGVLAGLPRPLAWKLALENVKGAVAMLEQTKLHPRQLLDINNSPGGVGIHALHELNASDFAAGLQRAVVAAVQRTSELGARK